MMSALYISVIEDGGNAAGPMESCMR